MLEGIRDIWAGNMGLRINLQLSGAAAGSWEG